MGTNRTKSILPAFVCWMAGGFVFEAMALEVGGGTSLTLRGLVFDLQLRDTINRYWGKTQHDLIFSGGLVWRIR